VRRREARKRLLTAIPKNNFEFSKAACNKCAPRAGYKIAQKRGARRDPHARRHPFGQVENTERKRKKKEQQTNKMTSNIQMKDTNDGVVVKADGRTLLAKLVFAGSARLAECDLGIDELRAAFKHAHGDEASKVRIRCL